VDRKNDWAVENQLDDTVTLLYSGTLGLKHNPALLVELASEVRDRGKDVQLVVVNEGPAIEVVKAEAERLDVPLTLLPFQPYDRLPEVLGSGDILVVLLEQQAGAFSVPSKTLSYLCAGRPILGLMPSENLAAQLIDQVGGYVAAPLAGSIPEAATWATDVLSDPERRMELGEAARDLAEREFALSESADRFETILVGCGR
jgi:glycosyltransferase involved in cell wall biosynthesis